MKKWDGVAIISCMSVSSLGVVLDGEVLRQRSKSAGRLSLVFLLCLLAGFVLFGAGVFVDVASAGNNAGAAFSIWPDTGQTKCYDDENEIPCPAPGEPFYGQDAQYQGPQRSYTKLGYGGVELPDSATISDGWIMTRDNVTGLIWEIKTSKDDTKDYSNPHDADNTYTWCDTNSATNGGDQGTCGDGTDTEDFINTLNSANFGGYSDWRLPTLKELSSLVNSGVYGPAIDTTYFPNIPSGLSWYWSSTTYAEYTYNAGFVLFSLGGVGFYGKHYGIYVRAVRSGQDLSSDHLVDNHDGTITDTATGLMWQKCGMGQTYNSSTNGCDGSASEYTWQQALAECENFVLAGHSDWRLPNRNELQSIIDYSRYNPAIDTIYFSNTMSSGYWSSTTDAYKTSDIYYAWLVHFDYGYVSNEYKNYNYYVRAVRSGPSGSFGNSVNLVISKTGTGSGTVTSSDGGISCGSDCSERYNKGGLLMLSVTPDSNSYFAGWTGDCEYCGNSSWCLYQIHNDTYCRAIFQNSPPVRVMGRIKSFDGSWASNVDVQIACGMMYMVTDISNSEGWFDSSLSLAVENTNHINCTLLAKSGLENVSRVLPLGRGLNVAGILELEIIYNYPVILVPGIMGSDAKWDANAVFPKLPKEEPAPQSDLELHNPFWKVGWRDIKRALREKGFSVFDCPYDWRLDVTSNDAQEQLTKCIQKAKDITGSSSVDIVAHSMGGLLVRSYIEGTSYKNDINRFAMVGTPNHGSVKAQPIWEKGDPIMADRMSGDTGICESWNYFYTQTLAKNYKEMVGGNIVKCVGLVGAIEPELKVSCDVIEKFIHENVKSIYNLVPDSESFSQLNNTVGLQKLKDRVSKIRLFASSSEDTPAVIFDMSDECSDHQVSVGTDSGDGTVTVKSAKLPGVYYHIDTSYGEHSSLIKKAKNDIVAFLTQGRPMASSRSAALIEMAAAAADKIMINAQLGFSVDNAFVAVTTPAAVKVDGIFAQEQQLHEETAEVNIIRLAGGMGISYTNPSDGTYHVTVTGLKVGTTDLTVSFISDSKAQEISIPLYLNNGEEAKAEVDIVLSANNEYPVKIRSQVLPPKDVTASESNGKTVLSWSDPPSGVPSKYMIFKKIKGEDEYSLIAKVEGLVHQYQTDDDYRGPMTYIYAVSSEDGSGRRSFMSEPVTSSPDLPSSTIKGDANGDGQINVLDVISVINRILNPNSSLTGNADCNGDGTVNVLDVICIINKILQGT